MSLNILQVLPALNQGGVERGTLEIAEAIIQAGMNSWVISSGGSLVSELEAMGAKHLQMDVHSKNPLEIWRNTSLLKTFIQDHNIDLLHVRSRAPAWSCLRACKQTLTPMVTTFHGQYGHANKLKRYYNSAMLSGSKAIAVSDFIAEHIAETYPEQAKRLADNLVTIYRGIDSKVFDPDAVSQDRVNTLLRQWNLNPEANDKVILLPGRLTRLKGHAEFIEALTLLRTKQPNLKFKALIVGPKAGREPYIRQLEEHISNAGLNKDVTFVGECKDMPAAYVLADIVVSSSTKPESFGRTTCEAQAMGKLIVASNHGGTKETLSDTQLQGLFAPNNPNSMAEALEKQCLLPISEINEKALQSRAHILKHYRLEKMKSDTISLYQSVCSSITP